MDYRPSCYADGPMDDVGERVKRRMGTRLTDASRRAWLVELNGSVYDTDLGLLGLGVLLLRLLLSLVVLMNPNILSFFKAQ
jgi:hypothetical protein